LPQQPLQNATPAGGGLQPVEIALARAAVFHQAGLLQLRKMRGDGALAHHQNLLQLGHGELLPAQKQQNAKPVGIGQHTENFYN